MIEGLQNYLIERSQDPVLADLYPTVDRGLALLAFELDGIGGVLLSEAGTIKNGSLAEYQKLREALDKDVVDLPTIKLLKAIKEAAKAGNSKTPEETAKAQKAIEAQEFTRDVILTGMENLPKEVNIARSWDEYALQRTQLKNKYPHINDTDEDLLLIALFPRDNQVGNLFKQREEAFKHLAQSGGQDVVSERYTETALRALGLTELADQQQRLRIVSSSSVTSGTKMENPGGIDLNPANLNLQIKRDGQGVPLPVNLQDLPNINVNGFVPVIINISPVKSLPALLLGEAQPAPASSPATMARQKKKG
jgi:hypothetical protein